MPTEKKQMYLNLRLKFLRHPVKAELIPLVIAQWQINGAGNDLNRLQQLTGLAAPLLGILASFLTCVPINALSSAQLNYLAALPLTNAYINPPDASLFKWTSPQFSTGVTTSPAISGYLLGQASYNLAAWIEYVVSVGG